MGWWRLLQLKIKGSGGLLGQLSFSALSVPSQVMAHFGYTAEKHFISVAILVPGGALEADPNSSSKTSG